MNSIETLFEWLLAASLWASILAVVILCIFERGAGIKSRIREISAHRQGRATWRITGGSILTLLMVFDVTQAQQADEPDKPEIAQADLRAESSPSDTTQLLEELRKAVREQEERVEERRKNLSTIVRARGIIHTGEDPMDDDLTVRADFFTSNTLEQEKMQIESQIESLLKYDSEQLWVYAAGLNFPDNIVKALYSQYLELQSQIDVLIASGAGENHSEVITSRERLEGLRRQLDEGAISLRATLQAQLDLAADRMKRVETILDESRDQAVQRALDAQDYVEARRAFETDQALLQELRLKLIGETISARMSVPDSAAPADPAEDDRKAAIQTKLDSIIIPRMDFVGVTIDEAIDFLRQRARELDVKELDPTKKGLNFVIRRPKPAGADPVLPPIIQDLRVRNVPLGIALIYICKQTGFSYEVTEHAVTLSPRNNAAEQPDRPE